MSERTKHTKGPWEAVDSMTVRGPFAMGDHDKPGLAICLLPQYAPAEERGANARLIAAAPDLLEAARMVEAGWVALCAFLPQDDAIEALEWKEFQALRAAIAKATT